MNEIMIDIILNGHLEENCMFVHRYGCNDGVLVDPGIGKKTILDYLCENHYNVKHIIITHAHVDHIYACDDIRKKYDCDIYVSSLDAEAMMDAKKNVSSLFHLSVEVDGCKTFEDNEVLHLLDMDFRCILTPGHTKGSTSFYIEEEKILLSGDTLFLGSCGRTDLYGGDDIAIRHSIVDILFNLPPDTRVFPGHGPDTSIGYEKTNNMILS
ncbi:MAG: MBL fold metallo-hydrolase [Lachnospiraceae bacterium]|nr:MBL fold metallo-hydrolase [Lachnospiraceae bacterium]